MASLKSLAGAALFTTLFFSAPASAQSNNSADCVLKIFPKDLQDSLASDFIKNKADHSHQISDVLMTIFKGDAEKCQKDNAWSDNKKVKLVKYSLNYIVANLTLTNHGYKQNMINDMLKYFESNEINLAKLHHYTKDEKDNLSKTYVTNGWVLSTTPAGLDAAHDSQEWLAVVVDWKRAFAAAS